MIRWDPNLKDKVVGVGHCYPGMPLMEKKPNTEHRRYSKISSDNSAKITKFSMKMVNFVLQQNLDKKPENSVCSPLLIDMVLNVLVLGSKGATLEQLLDLIGCEDVMEFSADVSVLAHVLRESKGIDGPEISFVNAVWVDQRNPLKKPFQQILKVLHNSEAIAVDFFNQPDEVVKQANLWAEEQSKGMIKEILSPGCFKPRTIMLLANALYFKGTWVEKFDPGDTKYQNFYLLNTRKKVRVPFMNKYETEYDYGIFEGCQVLRMLYNEEEVAKGEKARSFSMYIFLPEQKDGLSYLLGKIQMDSTMFMDKIKLTYKKIDLAIPKFKFECELPLKTTMMELGLTLPFDRNSKDITKIVEPNEEWLFVDDVFQKSYVEVDEEGTKAVTYTSLKLRGGGPPPPPPISFVADHPFLFLIREDFSGAILYVGTVLHP